MKNIITICYVMCFLIIECQLIKVSPKLDFIESKEETTKTKVAPKIQGVRVVVDTTNTKLKKSVESQSDEGEDNDSDDSSKSVGKKKTVGIRTDITFEISDDDDDTTNSTKTNKRDKDQESRSDDDDNSGPPIIKGNAGTNGNRKEISGSNDRKWNTHNIPVFHGTDDESTQHGGTGDHWSNFIPSVTSVWTTERSRLYPARDPGFRSNSRPQVQNPWKPCLCSSNEPSWRSNNYARRSYVVPLTDRSISVDDKLEYPFSSEEFKGK